MRAKIIVGLIAVGVYASFPVAVRGQDMGATNLGDFLGKERSSRTTSYDERKRLSAIYDNGVAAHRSKQYDRAISAFSTLLKASSTRRPPPSSMSLVRKVTLGRES